MKRSRFVYDRSISDDLAAVLSAARVNTWCEPQLITLDNIIRDFADCAAEHDHHFDVERFCARASYMHHRIPVGHHPDTIY